jgi:phosphoribosyl-ATP pyrophosphohydrolase/phosphoribosyl-AMP cyclohydrolase
VLAVAELFTDCDADAVVYLVDPVGPTCHTGRRSCFFEPLGPATGTEAAPSLVRLADTLEARRAATAEKSYTRSLLDGGPPRIGEKLREEADELARAVAAESDERVVAEGADLLYHLMVALLARKKTLRDVAVELARRHGRSGHDEKASR